LASDGRGLLAIAGFFDRLIQQRCEGEYARWGCMVSNAHAGDDVGADGRLVEDAQVREVLDQHHARLRSAMRSALETGRSRSQLRPGLDVDATADVLALLAYGVNLRSRAGAAAADLRATVTAALDSLCLPEIPLKEMRIDG